MPSEKNRARVLAASVARNDRSAFSSLPSSQTSHGLDATIAWKSAGLSRIAWSAKSPPAEVPARTRNGAVRYVASVQGTSSFSKKSRKRSAPPLVGAGVVRPSSVTSACVGVRSRVRSVFTTPTTIISGSAPARARKFTVARVCANCDSASVR